VLWEIFFILLEGYEENLVKAISQLDPGLVSSPEVKAAIFSEIGNIILNACVGTIVNELDLHVQYKPPEVLLKTKMERLYDSMNIGHQELDTIMLISQLSVGDMEIRSIYTSDAEMFMSQ
jgi:hypothetical protein